MHSISSSYHASHIPHSPPLMHSNSKSKSHSIPSHYTTDPLFILAPAHAPSRSLSSYHTGSLVLSANSLCGLNVPPSPAHSPLSNVLRLVEYGASASILPASSTAAAFHAQGGQDTNTADEDIEYVGNSSDSDGASCPPGERRRAMGNASGCGRGCTPYAYSASTIASSYAYGEKYNGSPFPPSLLRCGELTVCGRGVGMPAHSYAPPGVASVTGVGLGFVQPSGVLPVPIPVPNLTKKSRGRKVPTMATLDVGVVGSDRGFGESEAFSHHFFLWSMRSLFNACSCSLLRGQHPGRRLAAAHMQGPWVREVLYTRGALEEACEEYTYV